MRTIEVSEAVYEKIKGELVKEVNVLSDMIGKAFFFRTVTYHLTGRVVKVIGNIIELSDAAWIADSGRFMDAIKNGIIKEVEPVGRAWVNLDSVTDFFEWNHPLPTEQI